VTVRVVLVPVPVVQWD